MAAIIYLCLLAANLWGRILETTGQVEGHFLCRYNRVFRGIISFHKGFLAVEYGNCLSDLFPSYEMWICDSLGQFSIPELLISILMFDLMVA